MTGPFFSHFYRWAWRGVRMYLYALLIIVHSTRLYVAFRVSESSSSLLHTD